MHRIGKAENPDCCHCEKGLADSVEHTVTVCDAWTAERVALREVIGEDLSMGAIVKAMSDSEEAWKAIVHFSEVVMMAKETAGETGCGSGKKLPSPE